MRKAIFPEYLGEFQSETLLQELGKLQDGSGAVENSIRQAYSGGFRVIGEFELAVYETEKEKQECFAGLPVRIGATLGVLYPPGKKLMRLILEPITHLEP